MDSHPNHSLLEWTKNFFGKIPRLEKRTLEPQRYEQRIQILKMIVAFASSLLVAKFAYKFSTEQALTQWKKDHPPSLEIWEQSFAARGFYSVTNLKIQHRLARKLPLMFDSNGNVWRSPDGQWWILFYNPDPKVRIAEEIHVFSNLSNPSKNLLQNSEAPEKQKLPQQLKESLPETLELLHSNHVAWDHYHRTLQELAKLEPIPPRPSPPQTRFIDGPDPRELRY